MLSAKQQAEVVRLLPYVQRIARSFGLDDEFDSEAQLILCEAVPTWKPEFGVPIDQYVGVCVRRRLSGLLRRQTALPLNDVEAPSKCMNLHELVERLPERVRECARLRWSEDLFLHEVANVLGHKKSIVAGRLREARRFAQSMLENEGIDFQTHVPGDDDESDCNDGVRSCCGDEGCRQAR